MLSKILKFYIYMCFIALISISHKVYAEDPIVQPTPPAPATVSVPSSSSNGSYSLSWSSVNGAYYQWRESVNGSWGSTWTDVYTGTSVNFTGKANGSYAYQVRACNILAIPSCSSAQTSNTITVSVVSIPGTPSSISISDGSTSTDGVYTVSWGASSNSPTRYEYRESTNGSWGSWVNNGTSRSKAISGKDNGTYAYQARGCNSAGCGSPKTSSDVVVSIPQANGNWSNTGGSVPDASWSGDTPAITGNTNVGALEGSGGVSGGAATYHIPIVIPPGRKGMQPSVSLNYSSRSGNGIAGVGWSLSAGSSIHRCGQTYAQDGFTKNVTYSLATDRLCLDGQRLTLTTGTYGYSGAQYRTEIDSFARVTQSGGLNSPGATFKVEHKDGRISWYGTRVNSKHIAEGRTEVLSWALSQVEDRATNRNNITYDYHNYGSGEYKLKSIHYTGMDSTDGDRHVEFIYENRTDDTSSYLAGGLTRNTKRLSKIQTKYQTQVLREYRLNYGSVSAQSERSLLRDVTECAYQNGSAYCLPKTTFDWDDAYRTKQQKDIDPTSIPGGTSHELGDFDGDGILERFYLGTQSHDVIFTKNGQRVRDIDIPGHRIFYSPRQGSFYYKDIDNDGLADWLRLKNGYLHVVSWNPETNSWVDKGSTGVPFKYDPNGSLNEQQHFEVADINSDGKQDILVSRTSSTTNNDWHLYLYLNTSTSPTVIQYSAKGSIYNLPDSIDYIGGFGALKTHGSFSLPDINGDGLTDILIGAYRTVSTPYTEPFILVNTTTNINTPSFTKKTYSQLNVSSSVVGQDRYYNHADFNGDGLLDLIYLDHGGGAWKIQINEGDLRFSTPYSTTSLGATCAYNPSSAPCSPMFSGVINFMDVDGNGTTDIVIPKPGSNTQVPTLPYAELPYPACNIEGQEGGQLPDQYEPGTSCGYQNYVANAYGPDHSWFYVSALVLEKTSSGYTFVHKQLPTWKVRAKYGVMGSWQDLDNDSNEEFWTFKGEPVRNLQGETRPVAYTMMEVSDQFIGTQYDVIKKVTNGLNVENQWSYKAINATSTQDNFYNAVQSHAERYNDANYIHFTSNMYVVDEYKQSDGIGGLNATEYRYRGAMFNTQGRGFQGFKSIMVDDLSDSDASKRIRSVSDFHQKFPLAGKLEETRTCLIASGGEDCKTRPIAQTIYDWDLWRDGVYKTTVYNAQTNFSGHVLEGAAADNRYWVAPRVQKEYSYSTSSAQGSTLAVGTSWLSEKYQYSQFNSNGCQTFARSYYQEDINASNKTESETSTAYHTADTSNWWLCKPNTQTVTTKAVANRDIGATGFAQTESGSDFDKSVKTTYKAWDNIQRLPTSIETTPLLGASNATNLKANVWTEYNSYGLPTKVTTNGDYYTGADMPNRVVTTGYTADGYFVNSIKNTLNHETTTVTDPIHGQATQVTDPNGQVTTMTYDAFGRVRSTKLPGEPTQWMAYWWCSGVNSGSAWCPQSTGLKAKYRVLTRAKGAADTYNYYDNLNRHVYSITRNFNNNHWYYNQTRHNNKGQKTMDIKLNGGVSSWQYTYYDSYDALGRLTKKRT
ncbi:MAG: VCBS repeat-containing protein, partial [Kangiellaceae bacterium]|nr:VCBS repeat-containing protein [Kangiellaceae bacterium]